MTNADQLTYYVTQEYGESIVHQVNNDGSLVFISYEELKLSKDTVELIRQADDIYYREFQIEVGWKNIGLRDRYIDLMMEIGHCVKKSLGTQSKVIVYIDGVDKPTREIGLWPIDI